MKIDFSSETTLEVGFYRIHAHLTEKFPATSEDELVELSAPRRGARLALATGTTALCLGILGALGQWFVAVAVVALIWTYVFYVFRRHSHQLKGLRKMAREWTLQVTPLPGRPRDSTLSVQLEDPSMSEPDKRSSNEH